jgi:hypothetical protein
MLNRYLSVEVLFVHIGHGLLFLAGFGVVAALAPWWVVLIHVPIITFCVLGWLYEARFVVPVALRLWREGKRHA